MQMILNRDDITEIITNYLQRCFFDSNSLRVGSVDFSSYGTTVTVVIEKVEVAWHPLPISGKGSTDEPTAINPDDKPF